MKQEILESNLKDIELFGDFKSHKAEIDAEDLGWILQILSTNLYSDPIGSLIREYSSNAWDANVEAGKKDKPIEVGIITSRDTGSYWYVTDLGPGLSPERIDTVYRKFGKSTKRDSNEAIGMMGLGKFSGLSYTNEIYITTRVDGTEYQYLMHKSEGTPQIDLLISVPTDKPNGTTIKINIKDYRDKSTFISSTRDQLAFFENVYFVIDEEPGLNDTFKMVVGKTFTYSSLENRRHLRLKIGPVSYPLEMNNLDPQIQQDFMYVKNYRAIALNFNIGELAITPNRESILYNKQTIANIEARLKEFEAEFLELYNKNSVEFTNIHDYVRAISNPIVMIGTESYYMSALLSNQNASRKDPLLKDLGIPLRVSYVDEVLCNFKVTSKIQNGRKTDYNYNPGINNYIERDNRGRTLLFVDKEPLNPTRNKYLCETQNNYDYVVIKRNKIKLWPPSNNNYKSGFSYYGILGLNRIPRNKWRDTIEKFQKWQEDYIKGIAISYDDMVPTAAWLAKEKAAKKAAQKGNNITNLRKANGKILVKELHNKNSYESTLVNRDWPINKLMDKRQIIIYGVEVDKENLKHLYRYSLVENIPSIQPILTAKANHKYFTELPNYINVNEFMKGKHKAFSKLVSMYVLAKLVNDNYAITTGSIRLIDYLNSKDAERIKELKKYTKSADNNVTSNWREADFFTNCLKPVADELNLWDPALMAMKKEAEELFAKYSFTTKLRSNTTYSSKYSENHYDEEVMQFAVEIAKKLKVKLNLKHYQNASRFEEASEEVEAINP